MRLNNKIALMTGIGQGMGRATAKLFAQEGAKVIHTARTEEKLQETATQIQNLGGTSIVVPADVSAREEAKSVSARLLKNLDAWTLFTLPPAVILTPHVNYKTSMKSSLTRLFLTR